MKALILATLVSLAAFAVNAQEVTGKAIINGQTYENGAFVVVDGKPYQVSVEVKLTEMRPVAQQQPQQPVVQQQPVAQQQQYVAQQQQPVNGNLIPGAYRETMIANLRQTARQLEGGTGKKLLGGLFGIVKEQGGTIAGAVAAHNGEAKDGFIAKGAVDTGIGLLDGQLDKNSEQELRLQLPNLANQVKARGWGVIGKKVSGFVYGAHLTGNNAMEIVRIDHPDAIASTVGTVNPNTLN